MFYIFDLYDKYSGCHCRKVYAGIRVSNYTFRGGMITLSFEYLNNIVVGVFDTKDGTKEYYSADAILSLVKESNIDIIGCNVNKSKRGVSSVEYTVEAIDPSKEYYKSLAKSKILCNQVLDLKRRVLRIPSSCVNDNVLTLPVGGVSLYTLEVEGGVSDYSVISVPTGYNIHSEDFLICLSHLRDGSSSSIPTIVFEDEFRVTAYRLCVLGICNIISKTSIKYTKKDLDGVFRYPSFYDISRNNNYVYLQDNYKRVIIDLYNKAIVREDL